MEWRSGIHEIFLIIFLTLQGSVFISCALISLEDEESCRVYPSENNQILLQGEILSISFPVDVNPLQAEQILTLSSRASQISCSFNWSSGSRVELTPLEALSPGIRYTLQVKGQYVSREGQILEADVLRFFYYKTDEYDPLRVLSFSAADDTPVSDSQPLIIHFNRAPDEASLLKNLSISPETPYNYILENSDLELTPRESWENLTDYTLTLEKELTCRKGHFLDPPFESSFSVVSGTALPAVLLSGAAEGDLTRGFPYRGDGSQLPGFKDAFRISFSEEMDKDSVENAFSLNPYPGGDLFWIDKKELIFLPAEGWLMEQVYELRIDGSAMSLEGIPLGEDFSRSFKADIPLMGLNSLECLKDGGLILSLLNSFSAVDLPASEVSPFDILFRLTFSSPFVTEQEKQKAQEMISLYETFSSGGSPRAASWSWSSDYTLTILYSGFMAEKDREHYYMLEIQGGEWGLRNDRGSFLPESLYQLFRCLL